MEPPHPCCIAQRVAGSASVRWDLHQAGQSPFVGWIQPVCCILPTPGLEGLKNNIIVYIELISSLIVMSLKC